MIRGLDIPRGRLATLWPLQRTRPGSGVRCRRRSGCSHVAQNEGQEEEVEGLEHAARPVCRSRLRVRREASTRRRSEYGRNHWPPDSDRTPMANDIHRADGTTLANPGPRPARPTTADASWPAC
ncbi:hypothetical protein ACPA9J_34450 [Pseudomonas aeruginosa]